VQRIRILTIVAAVGCAAAALTAAVQPASAVPSASAVSAATPAHHHALAAGALVSVGSPSSQFQQNVQAQPALAVDPVQPNLIAAAGNDLVDLQPCSKEASVTAAACSTPATAEDGGLFNPGVGTSGVYFSYDSGHSWNQPTYQGLTAAGCSPTVEPCTAVPGPIHTVPNYYESGLATAGDAAVAFGPVLKNGKFSWANGSRLYYSSQAANLTNTAVEPGTIDATLTVTVSHIDDPTQARVANQADWSSPVIVPKTQPAVSDPTEPMIWADNASSSKFFGNVYLCYNDFYFSSGTPVYPRISVSHDGGQTWTTSSVADPVDSASQGYRLSCTIRTDSHGVVYAFFTHYPGAFPTQSSDGQEGAETMVKSYDGGATWTKPVDFMPINDGCYYFDPVQFRCTMEGPGGSPAENGPSVDIANGAPTGADATNEIVLAWSDGRYGENHEATLLSYSTDGAQTWSTPAQVSLPGDRSLYSAVAISPNGSRLYLTYNAFTTPFSQSTSTPRLLHGVLRSAAIKPDGAPARWTTDYVSASGDARGTGFGTYNYDEFLGFFISAVATRTYGDGAWTDVSRAADCPAMDAWRESDIEADNILAPAPWPLSDCPANFGNSDLWNATTAR
jgi:hypothetical protein